MPSIRLLRAVSFCMPGSGRPSRLAALVLAFAAAALPARAQASPTVTAITPASGPVTGGVPVIVTGTNFETGATVSFGSASASSVTVLSDTVLAATAPAGAAGAVDITVTTSAGTSAVSSADQYTYVAAQTYLVTTLADDDGPPYYDIPPPPGTAANCLAGATSNASPNDKCSLRDAIAAANALNGNTVATITFNSSLFSSATAANPTIYKLGSWYGYERFLPMTGSMTITGPVDANGNPLLAIDGQRVTDPGHGTQVLGYNGAKSTNAATVSNLIIQNAYNLATHGGGLGAGGGGAILLNNVVFNQNDSAYASGGGINASNGAIVTLLNSTVSNNYDGGGVFVSGATVNLYNTTISGNSNQNDGGGVEIENGGHVTMANVTISGNSTSYAGGILVNGATASLYMERTTVSGNNASAGEGAVLVYSGGSLAMKNSLLGGDCCNSEFAGSSNDLGGNKLTDFPLVAPLGYYGGHRQTMPPLPGSPALCNGITGASNQNFADERGATHGAAYCSAGHLDSGAVQTSYSLAFTRSPGTSYYGAALTPAPIVTLSENSIPFTGGSGTINLAATAGTLSGTTSAATSTANGQATFSNVSIPTVQTADTLTASLALLSSPSVQISATSGSFDVTALQGSLSASLGGVSTIAYGQTAAYTLQIGNNSSTIPIASMSVTVALPAGLSVTGGTGAVCGGANAHTITGYLVIDGINLAASGTCQASFTLTSIAIGNQTLVASSNNVDGASSASLNVTQAQPTLSWTPSTTTLQHGVALGGAVLDASSTVSGSIAYTATLQPSGSPVAITSASSLPSGAYQLTATFTPTDATDYASATSSVSVTVLGNDIFAVSPSGVGSLFSTGGVLSMATSGGGIGAAIDANGNLWSIDSSGSGLAEFNRLGVLATDLNSLGLSGATALAVDGNNHLWITNGDGSILQITTAGTVVSLSQGSTSTAPASVAIDTSGNVWVTNTSANSVDEVIGGAAPTAPLAQGVQSNTLGVKP
ncbi:MAG: IPT/TIG domain-containing protein [Acidobacteriota bacterium]